MKGLKTGTYVVPIARPAGRHQLTLDWRSSETEDHEEQAERVRENGQVSSQRVFWFTRCSQESVDICGQRKTKA